MCVCWGGHVCAQVVCMYVCMCLYSGAIYLHLTQGLSQNFTTWCRTKGFQGVHPSLSPFWNNRCTPLCPGLQLLRSCQASMSSTDTSPCLEGTIFQKGFISLHLERSLEERNGCRRGLWLERTFSNFRGQHYGCVKGTDCERLQGVFMCEGRWPSSKRLYSVWPAYFSVLLVSFCHVRC